MKTFEADVVIVGSGVAGALSAYKLAKKGIKVLVLEAGPRIKRQDIVSSFQETHKLDFSSGFPNEDWAPRPDWGTADGDSYIKQTGPTKARMEYLRVVGGTTWHWSANSIRLMPVEFKMKSTYGIGTDWPIDYDTIEPYYVEAEHEMGVAGDSDADYNMPRSKGFPLPALPSSYLENTVISELEEKSELRFISRTIARNSRPYQGRTQCKGFGTCSPICPSGAQYSAIVHVEKAEQHGAEILENMLVDRVTRDDYYNITGVEGRHPKHGRFKAKGKIVILAANGIETPKLLMMSKTETEPNGMASSSGRLGRYFMGHPGIYCRFLMPKPVYPGRGPHALMQCLTQRDGDFRKERGSWTMSIYNELRLHDIANDLLREGVVPPKLDEMIKDRALRQTSVNFQIEQKPVYDNGITLDWDDLDSSGQPRIQLHYGFSDYETNAFKAAEKEARRIVGLLGGEVTSVSDPTFHHHFMGMTMMGNNPKTSVTDQYGQTHDYRNLFVTSSSLFPTGGTANPTLTIAALALRTADYIAKQLGK